MNRVWEEGGDIGAVAEHASRHSVALAGYTILTPMPGTALYRQMKPRIVDHDYEKYNFFNCVLETKLPIDRFYERMGELWKVRLGDRVI